LRLEVGQVRVEAATDLPRLPRRPGMACPCRGLAATNSSRLPVPAMVSAQPDGSAIHIPTGEDKVKAQPGSRGSQWWEGGVEIKVA